jgi:hypothetical protein
MKKSQLRQIIKEEISKVLTENRKFNSVEELKDAIDALSDVDTDYVLIPNSLEVSTTEDDFEKIYANNRIWKEAVKREVDKTLNQQDPRTVGVKYFYLYQGSPGVYSIEFL